MTRIVIVRVALMNDERWVVGVVDREVEGVEGRGCLFFGGVISETPGRQC